VEACRKADLRAAGSVSTQGRLLALYNTAGIEAYQNLSGASVSLTASTDTSTGWAERSGKSAGAIDVEAIAETAIHKALSARDPATPEPGEYEVVLEPAAVTDFLLFMGALGLGGLPWLEGRSLFSDKTEKRVFSTSFTLRDDAYHPMTVGIPFDFEGSPRQAVTLVERGVFKRVVHDRRTARRAGCESTGHALPLPNTSGPLPLNLVLEGGDASLDDLIASTRKGLLITRFHYTNVLDPKALVLTGMTRFGTFVIENGRVGRPVQNMRFTDELGRVLSRVDGLTSDRHYCASFFGGGYVVPGMKLARLAFTSGTDF
jgi:predicted Zn-dependent protease